MKKKCCKNKWHWKIGLSLLIIVPLLFMFGCKKTIEQRAEYIVSCISSKLDLSEAQTSELNRIKNKALLLHKEHQTEKEEQFTKIRELLLQERISEDQVKEMIHIRRQRIDNILPQMMPDLLAFHESLTSEQKQELIKQMDKLKKKFDKWHK